VPEKREQEDDGQRNSEKPKQQPATKTHVILLLSAFYLVFYALRKPICLDYRANRTSRMMMGMGIPRSHKRIGIACSFRFRHQGRGTRRRSFHVPSRSWPPSTLQGWRRKRRTADRRSSRTRASLRRCVRGPAAALASATPSSTRFSASAWLMPVRGRNQASDICLVGRREVGIWATVELHNRVTSARTRRQQARGVACCQLAEPSRTGKAYRHTTAMD